jgi:hypothetical protein
MLKKITLFLLMAFFVSGAVVYAQAEEELPSPGITPDNPFYFLKTFVEDVGTFFTFGDAAKAERYAKLAQKRIAEVKAMADKGKPEKAEKALNRYQLQLEKALARAEKAKARGKDITQVTERVAQATSKHFAVLDEVLERVPEQAKEAIIKAKEVSKKGQINALRALVSEKPEKAGEIVMKAAKLRLSKAEKEALRANRDNLEEALGDYEDYRVVIKEFREKNKALASFFAEKMTEQIDDLDEIEEKAVDKLPSEVVNKIRAARGDSIDEQINALRHIAKEKPEKVIGIFSEMAEKRLNMARNRAEKGDSQGAEESADEYDKYASFGHEISTLAKGIRIGETTVEELVKKATSHHLEVLEDVHKKLPQQAKGVIEQVIENNKRIKQGLAPLKIKVRVKEEGESRIDSELERKEIKGKEESKGKEETKKETKKHIPKTEQSNVCSQVITPAKNPQTGKCQEFSTPCDVPVGWLKVDRCEENMKGLQNH